MKKSIKAQIAVLLIFLFGFVLLNIAAEDRDFSPVENRVLAQRPDFSWDGLFSGEFMKDFESYITDQFAGRDTWTALKAYAERALGKRENNGVYICGDTLIERFDAFDEKQLESNLRAVERFMEKADIPTYLMLIPTAAEIWKDRLPAGAAGADQAAVLEQVRESTAAHFVNVHAALAAHRDEEIFYRTDHHWTSLGACFGADALLQAMELEGVAPDRWEAQTVSSEFYGTLWSSSGARYVSPDRMDIYVPDEGIEVISYEGGEWIGKPMYDLEKLGGKDQYSMFLGGNQPLAVLRTGVPGGKLLIVRDSYADCMAPFLTGSFSEIHLIDLRYYRMSIAEYVRENDIDAAAVVYSLKQFVTDRNVYFLGG